jgi:hypothetical protein
VSGLCFLGVPGGALRECVRSSSGAQPASFAISSIRAVRFEWLNRAARLVAPAGAQILRLAANAAVQDTFTRAASALDLAA